MRSHIVFNNPNFLRVMSGQMAQIVPKAISKALNNVAFDAQRALKQHVTTDLHSNNSWLKKRIEVEKSSPASQKAEVGWNKEVNFAELLVKGGKRRPHSHKYIAVPVEAKNSRGKVNKAKRPQSILNKRGYYIATINGTKGIWYRTRRSPIPKLMYTLQLQTDYQDAPYLDWQQVVITAAQQSDFEQKFMDHLTRALGP